MGKEGRLQLDQLMTVFVSKQGEKDLDQQRYNS